MTAAKADEIGNYNGSLKPTNPISHLVVHVFPLLHPCAIRFTGSNPRKSYLICFQWSVFFPCCADVSCRFLGSNPHKSYLICVPCSTHVPLDFPGQIHTSPISPAFSGQCFSPAAPWHMRITGSSPHKSYLTCFW